VRREDGLEERRQSNGRASVSAKQLKNMVTNKAALQAGPYVTVLLPIFADV
jgi:hypothetical protein